MPRWVILPFPDSLPTFEYSPSRGGKPALHSFFREAILMMELPRRHAASLERAAGSHPIRVQSMGGGRGRGLIQMIYSSSGLLRSSVWQMRRLWLAAHQTPLACASISHVWCAEKDNGVSSRAPCPSGAETLAVKFEDGEACQDASMLGSAI